MVLEELGAAAAAVPFLSSAVVATSALLAVPAGDARDLALRRLATGDTTAALAVPLTTAPGAAWPASTTWAGGALTGTVTSVADGELAGLAVVPARSGGEPVLVLADAGWSATPRPSFDQTRRLAELRFDATPGTVLATGDDAVAALEAALLTGAGLLASEQLGVAQWCLDETVALREGPASVRAAGRLVPGAQASARRRLARGHVAAGGGPVRGRPARATGPAGRRDRAGGDRRRRLRRRGGGRTRRRRRCSCTVGSA